MEGAWEEGLAWLQVLFMTGGRVAAHSCPSMDNPGASVLDSLISIHSLFFLLVFVPFFIFDSVSSPALFG